MSNSNSRSAVITWGEIKLKHSAQMLPLALLALLLAACTLAPVQAMPRPLVPEALRVQPDEHLMLTMPAEGVQIYQCLPSAGNDAKPGATTYAWTFQAPDARLFDSVHNEIGTHYAGLTWHANDGSKVVGEVVARADAPDVDAVPWLLLKAKSVEGLGVFSQVSSIQRLETSGGKAPQSGCDQAHGGDVARVPYTAVYYFFTIR